MFKKDLVKKKVIKCLIFQTGVDPSFIPVNKSGRILLSSTNEYMYEMICSDNVNRYVIFEDLPRKLPVDPNDCECLAIGKSYIQVSFGSVVYKRTFKKALVKSFLNNFGLLFISSYKNLIILYFK